MFKVFYIALFVACFGKNNILDAAFCGGQPDPNAKPNMMPILDENLIFLSQVKNAKLYVAGSGDEQIYVVHLWGTPYQMGLAHGQLVGNRLTNMVNVIWTYMENQIIEAINGTAKGIFKEDFLKAVSDFGLDTALDLENLVTDQFTGKYFMEEMDGIAAATGLDPKKLRRIHLFGELTKGSCSMLGAWGAALPNSKGLLQLRALDWITDAGLQNYPQITVYHPSNPNENDFANIGWTGWIGSIQGFNSKKLATSEIGVSCPDDTFGKDSRVGTPFTYLLRDILQFDNTLEDSQKRMNETHRTCNLILGVGDGKSNKFNSVQYSKSVANFMNDTNLKPEGDWHPRIPNIVYHGMDWLDKAFNILLAKQVRAFYGNITAENGIRYISSIQQSGSLIVAYYDFTNDLVYIANARGDTESGPRNAFDRSYVRIRMSPLFNEQPPSL